MTVDPTFTKPNPCTLEPPTLSWMFEPLDKTYTVIQGAPKSDTLFATSAVRVLGKTAGCDYTPTFSMKMKDGSTTLPSFATFDPVKRDFALTTAYTDVTKDVTVGDVTTVAAYNFDKNYEFVLTATVPFASAPLTEDVKV